MAWFHSVLLIVLTRAETLVPLLAAGFFMGELAARISGIEWGIHRLEHVAVRLERKLNRPNRSIATRVYRGMVALAMVLMPMIALGLTLMRDHPAAHVLSMLVLVALFGHGFGLVEQWRYWRRANQGQMPLELPRRAFLFADSHAVIRYLILNGGERFAVYVVGAAVGYALGGMVLVLAYVLVAQIAHHHQGAVFGWASNALFRLLDVIPRMLTLVLLTLGGLFVPGAKPWRVRKARNYYGFLAYLTGSALGGTLPSRELPWAGEGTPKALPVHFARWLLLEGAAGVMLVLACATPIIVNTLNRLH